MGSLCCKPKPGIHQKQYKHKDSTTSDDVNYDAQPKPPRRLSTKKVVVRRHDSESEEEAGPATQVSSQDIHDRSVDPSDDDSAHGSDVEAAVEPSLPRRHAKQTDAGKRPNRNTATADEKAEVSARDPDTLSPVVLPVGGKVDPTPMGPQEQMVFLLQKLCDGQQVMQVTLQALVDGQKELQGDMSNRLQDINVAIIETGKKVQQLATKLPGQHKEQSRS